MDELITRALQTTRLKGAGYADVRVVQTEQERYVVRNGAVDTLSMDQSMGFGVRVLVDGAWGFASSRDLSANEVDRVAGLAVQVARASALVGQDQVNLGSPVTSLGSYTTPIQVDPFTISPEAKLELLLEVDRGMALVSGLSARQSNLVFIKEQKTFTNSQGTHV